MSEDLQLAAKVHYGFLPDDYEDDRLNVAVNLCPLYAIGGDYCSILPLGKNLILSCICDAVGHGVSAALFAARINTYVLTHAKADLLPCELVAGLNAYLCNRLAGTGMYATFYALLLDFESGAMTLTGAAHPPVLQLEKDHDSCREWSSITTLLGIEDPMPLLCGSERLRLNAGDRFLLYSDGLIEVEDADAQAFGTEGLSSTLIAHRNLSGQELNKAILMQAESHASDGFKDDVLLMSITLK
jgi:sigma-B regulation protein RsbU (phosphoserine phosphatase)